MWMNVTFHLCVIPIETLITRWFKPVGINGINGSEHHALLQELDNSGKAIKPS
jgi:hypothetical protein